MYYIYKAKFKNGKVYIGITNNFERRKADHKKSANQERYQNYPMYRAINKYEWDSIEWEVVETVDTEEDAKTREIELIEKYDSAGNGGYNITKGGDYPSNLVYKVTDEELEELYIDLENNRLTMQEIADKYGISISNVSMICNGLKRTGGREVKREKMARRGSTNGNAKLSEEQVSEIKKRLIAGESRKSLREEFGVSKSLIQMIAVGTWWSHVEPKIPMKKKVNAMTKEKVEYVQAELERGRTAASIMKELKMSPSTMNKLKKGQYDHLLGE